jgi:hypothetical protein
MEGLVHEKTARALALTLAEATVVLLLVGVR